MSKPREFWFNEKTSDAVEVAHIYSSKPKDMSDMVHVIEVSAYRKAVEALKRLVWDDRPDSVPETWQDRLAKQTLKELGEIE